MVGKILAIDFGTRRIGLAISDDLRMLARPLPHLLSGKIGAIAEALRKIITTDGVSEALVGLPRNMDGSYGPAAETVRQWVQSLRALLPVPVRLVDERLTTRQATRMLHEAGKDSRKQRSIVDSAAACVLLQGYLDAQTMAEFSGEDEETGDRP
jgi:putative Holliday junction resolvase